VLIEADATDPPRRRRARPLRELVAPWRSKDSRGAARAARGGAAPFEVRVHRLYNPEGLTQLNIVPGSWA
jgi:ABC-2 type transport system permease protein